MSIRLEIQFGKKRLILCTEKYLAMGGGTISAYSADRDFAKKQERNLQARNFH